MESYGSRETAAVLHYPAQTPGGGLLGPQEVPEPALPSSLDRGESSLQPASLSSEKRPQGGAPETASVVPPSTGQTVRTGYALNSC